MPNRIGVYRGLPWKLRAAREIGVWSDAECSDEHLLVPSPFQRRDREPMPRYIVHVTEKTYLRYTIEAESEEAAKQKYLDVERPDKELEHEASGSVGEVNFVEEEA